MTIEEKVNSLSLEDLAGQVLCLDIYDHEDPNVVEETIKKIRPGGIFVTGMTAEKIKLYTDMVNKYTKVPVIVSSDVEHGPETAIVGGGYIPHPMAWGACDDEKLIERAGCAVGAFCRKNGVHWTYSPVVDLNYNFRSPECNIRAISDSPRQVVKIAGAFIKGLERNNQMVAAIKHFPGEGVDERNSHFVTTINDLSKEEWMSTYGFVYKEMIKAGVSSIMVGHTALPAYEEETDPLFGPPPAVLSYSLMTKLLKGELGFDGCLVSDAMSMIGVAARVPDLREISLRFLKAGGDMILFPEPTDYGVILKAVKKGELPLDRLKDAVARILKLKEKARLFEDQQKLQRSIIVPEKISRISQEIADKSIKIVRDYNYIIPCKLQKGGKVLLINILEPHFHKSPTGKEFDAMKEELESNGFTVDVMTNPKHKVVQSVMHNYEMILMNCSMNPGNYHGGTMRIGWNNIMTMWRGYVLQHPRFIFISFGDPYKLFDAPYLKEYINAFSDADESQRAVVKVLLGKIKAVGKNPVSFKGFFEREI